MKFVPEGSRRAEVLANLGAENFSEIEEIKLL